MEKIGIDDLKIKDLTQNGREVFIITSASVDTEVDTKYLKTIKNFCNIRNADPIVLGSRKHERALKSQPHFFSSKIKEVLGKCLYKEASFGNNLLAIDAQINPQQINPLTGLTRYKYGSESSSLIIASPKQMLQSIPVGNNKTPRVICSTGTISTPEYQENRIGRLSTQLHTMGAVIVEIIQLDNKKKFLIRHVTFNKHGHFVDLGVKYTQTDSEKVKTAAIVLGDLHAENIDENSLQICLDQLDFFKPKFTILHDMISYNSISHHNKGKILTQSNVYDSLGSLADEINSVKKVLKTIDAYSNQICIVNSNHHDHLDQWLDHGTFAADPVNFELGCQLSLVKKRGTDVNKFIFDPLNKYVWFNSIKDEYVEGVHISSHGHRGGNGSRGSAQQLSNVLGSCICGHTHSPQIFEGYMCVGVNASLRLDYNKGPSSWLQANAVVYNGGFKQLLISIPNTDVWKK